MAFRRTDLDMVNCPVCGTQASLNFLRFHAIFDHRLRERRPIYDLLMKRTLTEVYSLPSDYTGPSLDDISPAELMVALRSGTPPRFGLRAMTVGREKIFSDLENSIQEAAAGNGVCHLLNGSPGAGKSHILNYIRETALISHAGVFKIDIAADGVSFSNLNPLIDAFLDHGLLPGGPAETGGEGVFDRTLLRELERNAREEIVEHEEELYSDSDLLNQMRRYVLSMAPQTASRLILRLEKYVARFRPPEHIFRLDHNDPDPVEFGASISTLLRDLGYEASVFLVDELEEDRNRASYETLAHLISNVPDGTCWILAATPDLLWGPRDGIDALSDHLTPTFRDIAIDLPPFTRSELNDFAERVLTIYGAQNPGISPDTNRIAEFCEKVAQAKGSPRDLLILLLGYLDSLPQHDASSEKT